MMNTAFVSFALALVVVGATSSSFLTTPVTLLANPNVPSQPLSTIMAQRQTHSLSIIMLWRSDCAPCLVELSRLSALRKAAGGAKITTLALEAPASAQTTARNRGLNVLDGFATIASPGRVLASAGQDIVLLPTSVVISANGRVCDAHVGILGTDQIREWVRLC